MELRRRERLRRQWISTLASAVALLIALGLMAVADVGPAVHRPERVLDFGAGPRPNHQGAGNGLTPAALGTPPVAHPVAHPVAAPGSEEGPPISANIVAVQPAPAPAPAPSISVDAAHDFLTTTTTAPPRVRTQGSTTTTEPAPTGKPLYAAHVHRPHCPHEPHTPHPARHAHGHGHDHDKKPKKAKKAKNAKQYNEGDDHPVMVSKRHRHKR